MKIEAIFNLQKDTKVKHFSNFNLGFFFSTLKASSDISPQESAISVYFTT